MDFIRSAYKELKDGTREFYPALLAIESQDLVIRGGQFVAIWDESTGLYNRRQALAPDIIDRAFAKMVSSQLRPGDTVKKARNYDNQIFTRFLSLIRSVGDMGPELDRKLVYANEAPDKEQAATFKLPYSLSDAACPNWDTVISTLYSPEERTKIEWAIGSIFSGESATHIQKFYVFFGPPGSGKSTIMNVIEMLFSGHVSHFSAYEMGRGDSQFSLEPFFKNPLVAIDQDGDLSRIEVNKNLNQIVSHDRLMINMKGKNLFEIIPRSTLFIGSNEPVKISNRKSGLFRRLVDFQPTGQLIEETEYHRLMAGIKFELGAIATHCLNVFNELGPTYLSSYRSHDMMYRTNDVFNFVEDNRLILAQGVTLKQAHKMFTEWCLETDTKNIYKQFQFRDTLKDYFNEFHDQIMVGNTRLRSYFKGLKELELFEWEGLPLPEPKTWLELNGTVSIVDEMLADMPAQLYSGDPLHPLKKAWANCDTTLKSIDTSLEHYVQVPTEHIVIDFDLKDEHGAKSLSLNLAAAAEWPPTYAEVSRGGGGLHLHYLYDGDVERLADGGPSGSYEIKKLLGNSSLRRRLSSFNNLPVAHISSGLPLKEVSVLPQDVMMTERGMRELILRNLRKEINPGTKPSMDFIKKIFDDAHHQSLVYDLSDMWDDILGFAMSSSNQRSICIDIAMSLKMKSDIDVVDVATTDKPTIAYFDCEVYPNLFTVGWMLDADDAEVSVLVNPKPEEVEEILKLGLIGYNSRNYDNHILYAATLGYSNRELYELSQRIVVQNDRMAKFGAAYGLGYADTYDYASQKKSLKKWQVELGLEHQEMDLPWDKDVPDDRVDDVISYMKNDIKTLRQVAKHLESDLRAREILSELTGLAVINTSNQHTTKLIFGDIPWDTKPDLVYTDLREMFPGYTFDQFSSNKEKSSYRGINVGEGGYVYAEPGIYEDVVLLDVASMHPSSIVAMNTFGQYTKNFEELLNVRLAIKAGDFEKARGFFGGRLAPYLGDVAQAKQLSDALKIVINSVYGLTAASFPNKFRDDRNIDNIVAKRGALFMVDLKFFVEERGFKVAHIKTDSIKIPGATKELIADITEFGKKYGYDFEHEATYEKFCLVNDAVYVAKYGWADKASKIGTWEAVGAQFQHPVVFKTLFSKEPITPKDYVEVKQVAKGEMYLCRDESKQFMGRFGAFVPVMTGRTLLRIHDEREFAVAGTKGYLWETEEVAVGEDMVVDHSYFESLISSALDNINKFGDYNSLIN